MKKSIFAIIVTAVLCVYLFAAYGGREARIPAELHSPQTRDIYLSAEAAGKIREIRSRSLGSSGYAVVDRIFVNVGDSVKEGQIIMSLTSEGVSGLAPDAALFNNLVINELSEEGLYSAVSGLVAQETRSGYIASPFDGIVTSINAAEGEQVTPFTVCASISDYSRMQAVVNVSEKELPNLAVGMPAVVKVTGSGLSYDGVVIEIPPKITASSAIIGGGDSYSPVVIEIYEPDGSLFSGASASAAIHMKKTENALTLPYEAVHQDAENNEYVYLHREGRAVKQYILTGKELSRYVEITAGLSAEDAVLISKADIYDGAAIEVSNAAD
ncbi:MAG: efflux RND transporter periplasmic adaptor subunit [Oscillospiraceae bacterium]|jgi:multidrug efflux pump subunit AcrA (membrane-fusion protein)|nr:efflux RND transporter periplasmic adaptor subunit [Oscillospiraceae bacterium]